MQHDQRRAHSVQLLEDAIQRDYAGKIALASSFGAESVVLLHMVSRINPATPILFNETGMLFTETLEYQKHVAKELGLTNVRLVRPTAWDVETDDPQGTLHKRHPDRCCDLRKVIPLFRALKPFDAWITGRKQFQSMERQGLAFLEFDKTNRTKINPLSNWVADDIRAYMNDHDLPKHPLVEKGFASIGCAPCTTPVKSGEDARNGRWRGQDKSECGIHFVNGRVVQAKRSIA